MNENNIDKEKEQDKMDVAFDLGGLLLDYLGNWKWFVLSVVLCAFAAHFYIKTVIPTYEVSASIYLNGDAANLAAQALSMSDNDMSSQKQFLDETEFELMKSRNNMMKVVDSLDLYYSYAEVSRFRNTPIYKTNQVSVKLDTPYLANLDKIITLELTNGEKGGVNVNRTVDGELKSYAVATFPDTIKLDEGPLIVDCKEGFKGLVNPMEVQIMPRRVAAGRLTGDMSIQYAEKSFTVVRINYTTPLVAEGVDVVNTMIKFYNDDIIADKNRAAIQTEAFIVDRLKMIANDLKEVETQLAQYQSENNAINLEGQTQMNMMQKQEAEDEIVNLRSERDKLVEGRNLVQSVPEFQPIYGLNSDPAVAEKIEEYNKKIRSYENLSNLTDENVQKRELKEEIPQLRRGIISTINQGIKGYDGKIRALQSQAGQATANTSYIPEKKKGLEEIFRDQQVKVNIYTFLLQKREDIALQKNLATPTARLIDDPTGSGPVSPKRGTIYALALLIGLAIPGGIIYLRRMLFPVFADRNDLERVTRVPVLSEINRVKKLDSDIVVSASGTTVSDELFRLLRNNIKFVMGKGKVMLVTSSLSGEGKTFIATNLAMSFALTGKRTLVVGLDIRSPKLAHAFGISDREGITNYLCGQTDDWASLVKQSSECPDLYVLPAGFIPPNPNELLLSDRLSVLIQQARESYDYIILDTAPIGLVSDSLLITHLTDVQIYVTCARFSTQRCIKLMHNNIKSGRLPHAYLVLNGVDMRSRTYYYRSYGQYGGKSGKGYGYGYGTETPRLSSRKSNVWRKRRK